MLLALFRKCDRKDGLVGLLDELQGGPEEHRTGILLEQAVRGLALAVLHGAAEGYSKVPDRVRDSLDAIVTPKKAPGMGLWPGLMRECRASLGLTAQARTLLPAEVVASSLSDEVYSCAEKAVELRNIMAHALDRTEEEVAAARLEFPLAVARLLSMAERKGSALVEGGYVRELEAAFTWAASTGRCRSSTVEQLSLLLARERPNPFRRHEAVGKGGRRWFKKATSARQLYHWSRWACSMNPEHNLRVLTGMSGSGKSSFLKAGLVTEIEGHQRRGMPVDVEFLEAGSGLSAELEKLECAAERQSVVLLDQFERALQLPQMERDELGRRLRSSAARPWRKLVFSVREDAGQLTVQWLKDAGLAVPQRSLYMFEPPGTDELVKAVTSLWGRSGGKITPQVVRSFLLANDRPRRNLCLAAAPGGGELLDPAAVQLLFHRVFQWWVGLRGVLARFDSVPVESEIVRLTAGLAEHSVREVLEGGDRLAPHMRKLARRVLVRLVDARGTRCLARRRKRQHLVEDVGAGSRELDEVLEVLDTARLVLCQADECVLVHDRLAETVHRLYGDAVQVALGKIAGCVDSVVTLSGAARGEGDLRRMEQFAARFFGDLAAELQGDAPTGLLGTFTAEEKREWARRLARLVADTCASLINEAGSSRVLSLATATTIADYSLLMAAMVSPPRGVGDILDRTITLLGRTLDKDDANSMRLTLWLQMLRERVFVTGAFVATQRPLDGESGWLDREWLARLSMEEDGAENRRANAVVRVLLREALSGGDIPLSRLTDIAWEAWFDRELKERYGGVPPSRFPLWRALLLLGGELKVGEERITRAVVSDGSPHDIGYLFNFGWRIVPSTRLTELFLVQEDARTYRGLLVHIPAGEHAMRNQRVARGLMIRTAAIETSSRRSSPGFHEADARELIDGYETHTAEALSRVVENHAQLLRGKEQMAWVILEAQEYSQSRLLNWVQETQDRLRERYEGLDGRVLADPGAGVANRKDLARALAELEGVPQPGFRVIGPTRGDEDWDELWRLGLEKPGLFSRVTDRSSWSSCLARVRSELGSRGLVIKPLVTEFLKGATVLPEAGTDLSAEAMEALLARLSNRVGCTDASIPSALVEEKVDVAIEVLSLVVERGGAGGAHSAPVKVPPIFYGCVPVEVTDDADVPYAFESAWTLRDQISEEALGPVRDSGLLPGLPSAEKLQRALGQIELFGEAIARRLWQTVESRSKLGAPNRFLACEWFVTPDGEVLLNEVKPTQLDKGIITNFAMSHSDSELLVRNLFGLPLPGSVRPAFAEPVSFLGTVIVNKIPGRKSGSRPLLAGFAPEGIDEVVAQCAAVQLYPDKMRSVPYAGRRFGVVSYTGQTVAEVLTRWRGKGGRGGLRHCLRPLWA